MVDSALNQSRFYRDGALSDTLGGAIATTSGGSNTFLGKQFGAYTEYFTGQMDNLRIWSGALSGSEVANMDSMGGEVPEPSTILLTLAGGAILALRRRFSKPSAPQA